MKKLLIAASLASALGALPAVSHADWGVSIDIAPPPPRVVVVPAPRPGWVWVPGYWDWRYRRHVWHDGYWVHERPGYVYAYPGWVHRDGHWVLMRGRWRPMRDRDHDHDGVPDAYRR